MRTYTPICSKVAFLSALFACACGGSSPSPNAPSESPPANADHSAAGVSSATPAPASGKDESAATKSGNPPSRAPREVLELKDTVFFLAFGESDIGKAAEANCSKTAAKNPKAMAACMGKAHEQADEGYRFEQDKDGTMWWLVVTRKGNTLVTLHKVRFTYGTETDNTISIKPEGRDTGSRAWKKPPAEVKFDVPNEYRIVVHDPERGNLVYEAKVGIASGK